MVDSSNTDSVAANVLGTIGTVLWCVQLIPQIIFNYRRKDCTGLPPLMLFLWFACGIPFSIYFISTDASIPVQVQPEVFMFFCTISWSQCLYYPPCSMKLKKVIALVGSLVLAAIAFEAGMITYFKKHYSDDPENWRLLIFGILASILLALGLIPPYFELFKRQGRVVGINFIFLAVDLSGAIFSMLSVAFGNMDILGIVLYSICAFLEIGIFTSHFIWCCRFKWFGNDKSLKNDEKESSKVKNGEEDVDNDEEKMINKLSTEESPKQQVVDPSIKVADG